MKPTPRAATTAEKTISSTFTATDAAGYDKLMGRWSRILAEPFLEFVHVANGENLLDVGCGTGSLAQAVARRLGAGNLIGIDVSPVYVDWAKSTNADKRISFEVGDASALRFADRTFDRTLSMLVLNFVPEHRKAAMEMIRVTRHGGTVAAATWRMAGGLVMSRMFWDTAAALDRGASAYRARAFSAPLTHAGELADLFREIGLGNVETRDVTIDMRFDSFADYWTPFLAGQGGPGPYIDGLSATLRGQLGDALRDAYCAGRADGPRTFAATAQFAKGIVAA